MGDGTLNLAVRRERGAVIAEVDGDIDLSTVTGLRERLLRLAGTGQTLIVDLNRFAFIDSAGLGVLVGVDRRIPLAATMDGALMLLAAGCQAGTG